MADAIHGNTELGATKQDLIASFVQRELQAEAKLVPTIWDLSQFAVKGAQSVSIPKLDSFSVINRASAAAGDATVLTSTVDKLDLDFCAYVAWIIDSCDEVQSTLNYQLEAAGRAAKAHGRYVDTQIITELESVGAATTTVGAISKSIILEMRETLLGNNANPNDLYLSVGVDSEAVLLAEADFVRPDAYGSARIPSGVLGSLYGVNVVVSNLIGASTFYMYESMGMGVAFQKAPQMADQGANEYGSGARRVSLDQLFGVKGMQVTAGTSALVVKDNN